MCDGGFGFILVFGACDILRVNAELISGGEVSAANIRRFSCIYGTGIGKINGRVGVLLALGRHGIGCVFHTHLETGSIGDRCAARFGTNRGGFRITACAGVVARGGIFCGAVVFAVGSRGGFTGAADAGLSNKLARLCGVFLSGHVFRRLYLNVFCRVDGAAFRVNAAAFDDHILAGINLHIAASLDGCADSFAGHRFGVGGGIAGQTVDLGIDGTVRINLMQVVEGDVTFARLHIHVLACRNISRVGSDGFRLHVDTAACGDAIIVRMNLLLAVFAVSDRCGQGDVALFSLHVNVATGVHCRAV